MTDLPAPNRRALRHFGLLMAAVLTVLFGLLLPLLFGAAVLPRWPWLAAGIFVLAALAYPPCLGPVYAVWMRFGQVMSVINTYLILGLVFFLLITPIGLAMRLLRIDPLNLAKPGSGTGGSLFIKSRPRQAGHMDKPF